MRVITIGLAALSLCACDTIPRSTHSMVARITYYSAHEDRYGSKTACGGRAREGRTVAAAPHWRFGQQVVIPKLAGLIGDGKFVVEDRGSAVTKERASHGQFEVIDVFLAGSRRACQHRMNELTRRVGYYTEVNF